jgi:hypothetical protein
MLRRLAMKPQRTGRQQKKAEQRSNAIVLQGVAREAGNISSNNQFTGFRRIRRIS